MHKLKIRNFKGLNTLYDSADIDIEFFTEYKNVCTKYGYIIPEEVTIEEFKVINNLVFIKEIYLDNDRYGNKVESKNYWARSESNYNISLKKYLLVVTKRFIKVYDNINEILSYDYEDHIIKVNILNKKGIAKVIINNESIYKILFVNRTYRFKGTKKYNQIAIVPVVYNNKRNFNLEIKQYTITSKANYDNKVLENEVYIPNIKNYYKVKKTTIYPFLGLNVQGVANDNYLNYNIAMFKSYEGEGIDYLFFEGIKLKLLDAYENNIYAFNRDMLYAGLGCPENNTVGFIKYTNPNNNILYIIPYNSLIRIINQNYLISMINDGKCQKWDNFSFTYTNILHTVSKNNYYWGYVKDGNVYYKTDISKPYGINIVLNGTFIVFTLEQLNNMINEINNGLFYQNYYVNKLVDIDATGLSNNQINKVEIVITGEFDNTNEEVLYYEKFSIENVANKYVLTLDWDNYNNMTFPINMTKLYFYYKIDKENDFQQFHCLDFQGEYQNDNNVFLISQETNIGIYLTQTIGHNFISSDYEVKANKQLIKANDIIDINGIQIGLYGNAVVYPAVGRGKILDDIYYKYNVIPDVEGDILANISNTLGVYNIDLKELYIIEIRNTEGILLFYLKESIPYIINKDKDIIYTPIGVIIMTNKGIVLFDGKSSTILSEAINNIVEEKYKVSNIFYDKIRQELHFINDRWYRYDFTVKVWNEFTIPTNSDDKYIIPDELINYDDKLLVRDNSTLYELKYTNNATAYLKTVLFQNGQDNIKIMLNDITYDENVNNVRKITKQFIPLKNRKFKDYLDFSFLVKEKLYSVEFDVDIIEINNMKLQYSRRNL